VNTNISVYGLFDSRANLEDGLAWIRAKGFRPEDVSVLLPENTGTKDLGVERSTKYPEGTATGGVAGAVTGGVIGWLAGIGAVAIPGAGPFIAAGPIMAALAGIGAGAAVGGIAGGLIGLGMPEYEALRYEGRVKAGGILVSIHCDNSDWASRAKKILESTGAENISSSGEAKADYSITGKPMPRSSHL
jgi:hypothetical protein